MFINILQAANVKTHYLYIQFQLFIYATKSINENKTLHQFITKYNNNSGVETKHTVKPQHKFQRKHHLKAFNNE